VTIESVVFDIGGTILDETREFHGWADWFGIPRHTFSAVFGACIARGTGFEAVFQVFRPSVDLGVELERRRVAGQEEVIGEEDLYPDARACLSALKRQGLFVGLAGNQPPPARPQLVALDLPVDMIGTSAGWGVAKPDAGFFDQVLRESGHSAEVTLYVGDRPDNDAVPAVAAGMKACLIRRGPWGYILDDREVAERCLFGIESLEELPGRVATFNAAGC